MYLITFLNAPLTQGITESLIYAGIGILMAFLAFKVIDWITPGKMSHQIANEGNVALAILVGCFIIGICIIIAQAISG